GRASMDSLRIVADAAGVSHLPCHRCGQDRHAWDRIAGKVCCPNCQEAIVLGEAAPLVEPTEANPCAICSRSGTVRFQTYPLGQDRPLEMDLCPEHLRGLIGRRLAAHAYYQLDRQLQGIGFGASEVFLLHEEFYDNSGRALRPAPEPE